MTKWMLFVLAGLCAIPATAQESPLLPPAKKEIAAFKEKNLWRTSVGSLALANVLDVQSSWGKRELNPSLANSQGTFGREGALLKVGIQGGAIALEYLVLRRRPSKRVYRALSFVNFGDAALTGAIAGRNYGVPRR